MFKASKDARHLVSQQLTLVARALQAAHFTIRNVHESEMALNDTLYHIVVVVSYPSIIHFRIRFQFQCMFMYTVYYIESIISMLHQV